MNIFKKVAINAPPRNKFDLTHERKFSLRMGDLVPFFVADVLPGDSFRNTSEIAMRLAPMLAPVMHRVDVKIEFFFCPTRLVWNEWEPFITGGPDGTEQPVAPYFLMNQTNVTAGHFVQGSLADYMGLPVFPADTPTFLEAIPVSAIPFRMIQLIYNEYYRDQNLSDPVEFDKGSGLQANPSLTNILTLRKRSWEKDYFTSALPWAQRGPEVTIPLQGELEFDYKVATTRDNGGNPSAVGPLASDGNEMVDDNGIGVVIDNIDSATMDATSTINDLRRSVRLQEWLEKNARAGARYIEQIFSHFKVKSSDARLQRPEYLSGSRQPVIISEVLSTYQDPFDEGAPQANMAGRGFSAGSGAGFKRTFEEHGYVIGLMSVLPRTAYQQGVPRHFSRTTKFDYAWPEFAQLGEQEILRKEIMLAPQLFNNNETFGYTPRYSEYKYVPSTVHGAFRDSLAYWHMGRIFDPEQPVTLNSSFVTADPTTRIFAVDSEDPTIEQLYCHVLNRCDALRPLPYFGTPTL